ncbi:MAG: endonuclease domain-containing protein [Elusimicrobia bacterium]|nr:endonuclease domain-containing protein [Elusimicrobiota bacterium]
MKIFNSIKNKDVRILLRKNQTDAEKKIWSRLRNKQLFGYKFYRQYGIRNYIVDFYCPKFKLVVEIDGGQHYDEKGSLSDKKRDEYFGLMKIKVLRFNNMDILKNIDEVMTEMSNTITPPVPL